MSIFKKGLFVVASTMVIVFIIMWLELTTSINDEFINSKAFNTTVLYIMNDSVNTNFAGKIIKVDSSVSGYLTPNKSARLVFDVKAERTDFTVTSELTYDNGLWVVDKIFYQ